MKKENSVNSTSGRNEVKLAVMAEKITNIEANVTDIKTSITNLEHSMDNGYAKRSELDVTRADVKTIQNQIAWAVKLVLGLVITAVVGLVLMSKR